MTSILLVLLETVLFAHICKQGDNLEIELRQLLTRYYPADDVTRIVAAFKQAGFVNHCLGHYVRDVYDAPRAQIVPPPLQTSA